MYQARAKPTLARVHDFIDRIPTINVNQLDPKYMSLGTRLGDALPNPFFGVAAAGHLVSAGDVVDVISSSVEQ